MPNVILSKRMVFFAWLILFIAVFGFVTPQAESRTEPLLEGSTTVLFYMNGDNDLTDEVLSAVDRMETIGSSAKLNIVALVDGHPDGVSRFGRKWIGTRLLYIKADQRIARIESDVLAEWGERDLGDPETLLRFVREAIARFPAERYIFGAFAHGKGVIDTGRLRVDPHPKTLSISPDATSQTVMALTDFEDALKTGLNGRRFSLMVLFSCLSSMVEIAYALGDVTDYLVASEDQILLVNEPPGTHQLRGISFEDLLSDLNSDPDFSDIELGRRVVDRFVAPYDRSICMVKPGGDEVHGRYPAGLTLIDCRSTARLVGALDELAGQLIEDLAGPESLLPTLADVQAALENTATFKSFLDLEYYDLSDWLGYVAHASKSPEIRHLVNRSAQLLSTQVMRYERHTLDAKSKGMSVFFGHHLLPGNIYEAHLTMYRRTRFSRDTRWDELIQTYRSLMRLQYPQVMVYRCREAYHNGNRKLFRHLSDKTFREVTHRIRDGRVAGARDYIDFLRTLPLTVPATKNLAELEKMVASAAKAPRTE